MKRKKGMRRVSVKQRKYMAAVLPEHRKYLEQNPFCVRCGGMACDVHHLAKRSKTARHWHPSNVISVCRHCHELFERNGTIPLVAALLFKARKDWTNYDTEPVNRLRGRAQTAITDRDVLKAAVELIDRLCGPQQAVSNAD